MRFRLLRGSVVAAAALFVAACSDLTPVGPAAGTTDEQAAALGGQGQDRVARLFERASPAVMALGGTVFADNDERIGKMVFGVENANAANGVRLVHGGDHDRHGGRFSQGVAR